MDPHSAPLAFITFATAESLDTWLNHLQIFHSCAMDEFTARWYVYGPAVRPAERHSQSTAVHQQPHAVQSVPPLSHVEPSHFFAIFGHDAAAATAIDPGAADTTDAV